MNIQINSIGHGVLIKISLSLISLVSLSLCVHVTTITCEKWIARGMVRANHLESNILGEVNILPCVWSKEFIKNVKHNISLVENVVVVIF